MGEIGAGNGSSYPSVYDTDNTTESSNTFVRYQIANDWSSCIVAIEQTLGINPEGSFSTVATRLDDVIEDWRRTGTTLSPYNLNDNVQISGTLAVGTATPSGTLDITNKFTVTSSGTLVAYNIPTYNTGVTGQIWSDGGALKIS